MKSSSLSVQDAYYFKIAEHILKFKLGKWENILQTKQTFSRLAGATEHYKMATVDMDISSLKAEINGYVMKLQEAEDTGNQKTWAELITASRLLLKDLRDEKAGELSFILHLQISP